MSRWSHAAEDKMAGRVVAAVTLNTARDTLRIDFADGLIAFGETEGDCCSQTWVEHLTVPPDVIGATVTGYTWGEGIVPTADSVNVPEGVYLDEIESYSDAIRTTRGEIIVEYRNSSNGYYGGSLEWRIVDPADTAR